MTRFLSAPATAVLLLAAAVVACGDGGVPEPTARNTAEPPWKSWPHLLGAVHEHSGFSDGEVGTSPADFYAAGRELGLAFMLGSDHSDNLRAPVTANEDCVSPDLPNCVQGPTSDDPLRPLTKWEGSAQMAAVASDAEFVAVRGFEWTSDRFGHINVFFSQNEINAKTTEGYAASMESFWTWFTLDAGTGGGNDGLLVFNHPGREDAVHSNIPDPAFTFNDFELRPEALERAVGIEVFGKSNDAYDTDNGAPGGGWYGFALDRGWSLGPVGAEDEHGREWGQPTRAKTVIIAADRSAQSIREALLARRFYALAQDHNDVRLSFSADNAPMGVSLLRPAGAAVQISGSMSAGRVEGGRLELVSNGGEIVAQAAGSSLAYAASADATRRWYYLRLINAEGAPVAYTSPIWITALPEREY